MATLTSAFMYSIVLFKIPLRQEPEPIIRSQTVVLRRSSDAEKQGNVEGDDSQQEMRSESRSKTVLLKQSDDKDKQLTAVSSEPVDGHAR